MARTENIAEPAPVAPRPPLAPRAPQRARRQRTIEQLIDVFPAVKSRIVLSDHQDAAAQLASITPHQADALCMLSRDGAMSMNDLARHLNIALSTATALADRLLRQGQVERIADPGDRRVVRLGLTAGAADTVRRHLAGRRNAVLRALEVLDDTELELLLAVLRKIAAGTPQPMVKD